MDGTVGRRVLLLQGPPTHFFAVVRAAFEEAGVPVWRVALHNGDALRAGGEVLPFRGRLEEFGAYLEEVIDRHAISDVLYYADRPPYHRIAQQVAAKTGVNAYVIENGYLRPDWLTLEPYGMSAYSRFPVDRAKIEAMAADAPPVEDTSLYGHTFAHEGWLDVTYNFSSLAGSLRYPHYVRDRHHPIREYWSWLPQLVRRIVAQKQAPKRIAALNALNRPYFLFPLQLQEDYQIRHNSRYVRLSEMIHQVFGSFARAAPPEMMLLVKVHPLDNGIENWTGVLKRAKREYGLTGRIRLMSAGPLEQMLARCKGVVLANSTVGLTAIRSGKPVLALGAAVYDLPGLTSRQSIDGFFRKPEAPDPVFADAFIRALTLATQLKGSFYHPDGMEVAAREIVRRVLAGYATRPWFEAEPPRLAPAIAEGVPADPWPQVGPDPSLDVGPDASLDVGAETSRPPGAGRRTLMR